MRYPLGYPHFKLPSPHRLLNFQLLESEREEPGISIFFSAHRQVLGSHLVESFPTELPLLPLDFLPYLVSTVQRLVSCNGILEQARRLRHV